jgi:hypothetical protein
LSEREAECPMCNCPLSVSVEEDERTGEIKFILFCEGEYGDEFELEVLTGLKNRDLKKLEKVRKGKKIPKEMKIRILKWRTSQDLEEEHEGEDEED